MKPLFSIVYLSAFCILPSVFSDDVAAAESYSANNTTCDEALLLSCQDQISFYSNFSLGEPANLDEASCLMAPGLNLREFWFQVDLTGAQSYFLDGNGVNHGIEVYTRTCKDLELVSCHQAMGNNTYISFYTVSTDIQYLVKILGYDYSGGSNFQVVLNCFNPPPPCALTIDQIQLAPCIDEGMVDFELEGSAYGNAYIDFVTCEILTDGGLFFFDGMRDDTTWQVTGEINGTEIEYIHVVCGNSENYCSDVVNTIALPLTPCDLLPTGNLAGNFSWNANCTPLSGEVSFYQPGTTQLSASYAVVIQNNGHFSVSQPLSGQFDIIIKVDGRLPKGFQDVEIATNITNHLDGGMLRRGEVSDDNFVNVVDVSMINTWFNQPMPDDSPMAFLDLNCDGIISLVDISVVNSSFGMVGDVAPLD